FTTAPQSISTWRSEQLANADRPADAGFLAGGRVSDDQIQNAIENGQLWLQNERGIDLTLFSPIASLMNHPSDTERTSYEWSAISNDLVHRVSELFPESFAPVCQLPQAVGM